MEGLALAGLLQQCHGEVYVTLGKLTDSDINIGEVCPRTSQI